MLNLTRLVKRSVQALSRVSLSPAAIRTAGWALVMALPCGVATEARGQEDEAVFIVRGVYYTYGAFGRYGDVGSFGPAEGGHSLDFTFPGSTENRRVETRGSLSSSGNILTVELEEHQSYLRAARTDGNDHGGGFDVVVDVYIKGPPGTGFAVQTALSGQVTALHGGGLGTTQCGSLGTLVEQTNSEGATSRPTSLLHESTGFTSTQPHPSLSGYYLATTVGFGAYGFTFQSLNFCFPVPCPELRTYDAWADFSGTITGICTSNPCPPTAELNRWNSGGTQSANNCYNYATNLPTLRRAQPGEAGGTPLPPRDECGRGRCRNTLTCADVIAAAQADGLLGPYDDPDSCPPGSCVVALVVKPRSSNPCGLSYCGGLRFRSGCPDYHWYRRNGDGTWSHKRGATAAKSVDESGDPILDPRTADRECYSEFCGFFCVPCGVTIAPRPPPPLPGQTEDLAVEVDLFSGMDNPEFETSDPAFVQAVLEALKQAVPAPAPDPIRLGFAGFLLRGGPNLEGFPDYVRFFDGLIHVYNGDNVEYFEDIADGYGAIEQAAVDGGFGGFFGSCPADWDGNGLVNSADVGAFLTSYFADLTNGTTNADFDGNNITNSADVGAYLTAYFASIGPCP